MGTIQSFGKHVCESTAAVADIVYPELQAEQSSEPSVVHVRAASLVEATSVGVPLEHVHVLS